MSERNREETTVHTRLLKCALEIDESRAYWRHVDPDDSEPRAHKAFEAYWFGARSLARVEVLVSNFRARYDRYPEALSLLRRWRDMSPETRALICHWHLQLADPMYRAFAGDYLMGRHEVPNPTISRDLVVRWVTETFDRPWSMSSRVQFATNLLSCAHSAGLVASRRDPRPLRFPVVPDEALTYLLYLLRNVDFAGSLLDNPYLASVGLGGAPLDRRLRQLAALDFRRMGDLVELGWRYPDLAAWGDTWLEPAHPPRAEAHP